MLLTGEFSLSGQVICNTLQNLSLLSLTYPDNAAMTCFMFSQAAEAWNILRDSLTFAIQTFLFHLIVVFLKGSAAQMSGLRDILSLGKLKWKIKICHGFNEKQFI